MKKGHGTVLPKMPEAKKTNTHIEKTILFQKSFYNGVRIHRIWNWESHYLQSISRIEKKIEYIFRIQQLPHAKSIKPKSCQKLTKSSFQYCFNFNLNRRKRSPKPKSCQKLEKSIVQYFFD